MSLVLYGIVLNCSCKFITKCLMRESETGPMKIMKHLRSDQICMLHLENIVFSSGASLQHNNALPLIGCCEIAALLIWI